jgi:hypothetical protein
MKKPDFTKMSHQKLLDAIRTEKALGGPLEDQLKSALAAFTSTFA